MNLDKYLPIGTVVLLKEGKHRLMIVGFCPVDLDGKNKIFDYIGCFYPEGLLGLDNIVTFNHSAIDKIFYVGLSDAEEKQFKNKLNDVMKNVVDSNGNLKINPSEMFKKNN